ncbi:MULTISPECIES: Gfo/Idh/MocA family oxidoreductase [Gimesia]|uniref:Putative oxidoreductase YdgJ n=1 Tax=Gimesia chilikensis TaxID=2605989 RepID=A0A517PIR1_9PLAN|nr:Gfo/Idh/MocA family oxidoreductase [Gimesia chilikensis]QDT19274.1 putative oxidoreductase YdgJ [Gimesia chilikensis]QDU01323.1 putative oxidoreductase YdgJ [Gimesia chilikensis]
MSPAGTLPKLKAGMVGFGMIVDETYRPFFETVYKQDLYQRSTGPVEVSLDAVVTRTGSRAEKYLAERGDKVGGFQSFVGDNAIEEMIEAGVNFACVASPDDRHFDACKKLLGAGVHVIVEKPSVLCLQELDELVALAEKNNVTAKVVYHKLFDPDHKRMRSLVYDGVLQHVNNGYCSLLEPKAISGQQFAQWITGRNPGTYVAVHYIKLIDFSFGGKLKTITAAGQRGLVGDKDGPTWDSCQMKMVYEYESGREAAFDIQTSWVTPDNFPGYVEQEVQFRFDNGLWNGHSRKRGVECTVEDKTPNEIKNSLNNHFNAPFVEPWNERSQRGYGIEVIEQFAKEVAQVEFGGPESERAERLAQIRSLDYNDLSADRQTVAAVQALEAILEKRAAGEPDCVVRVNDENGGLVLYRPGSSEFEVLYEGTV